MKKLLFLFIASIGISLSVHAQTKQAEFKFENETRDFGKITVNKPEIYTFNFTNEGDEPLIIASVEPTCGCTIGEFTKTPVKKGEKGFIKVTVNRSFAAPFNVAVTVNSNARTPIKMLYLKGEAIVGVKK